MNVANARFPDDSSYRTALAGTVQVWREALIDLSSRNRLLNYKATRLTSLELTNPGAENILAALGRGIRFAPLPDADDDPGRGPAIRATRSASPTEIVTEKSTTKSLHATLKALQRKATQIYNDYGLWTLQLGIGNLNWREDKAATGCDAPLILIPVRIERDKRGDYLLTLNSDDDARFNPALRIKLEQLHLDWNVAEKYQPDELAQVLVATTALVANKPSWTVSARVVLGIFASHKEAMYQDLRDNVDAVIASDLVGAVALGADARIDSARFVFDPIELDRIDEVAPPEDTPLVLDADSSQRQAVAAAVGGNSFVLDGPPGTGKSQTITNIIAALLHAGRSVLFVSEKAAALDVVLNRMRTVGLDGYVLALHSNNTSRKAVAQELGRALVEQPAPVPMRPEALDDLRATRQALSGYAQAMNQTRMPFEASIHEVIGRLGQLADTALADHLLPGPGNRGFAVDRLDQRTLRDLLAAAETIADVYGTVYAEAYPWRGVITGSESPEVVLRRADAALTQLRAVVAEFAGLAPESGAIDDEPGLDRLANLIRLLAMRHPVPESWLSAGGFDSVVETPVRDFLAQLYDVQQARTRAEQLGGDRWDEVPESLDPDPPAEEQALPALTPAGIEPADLAIPYLKEAWTKFVEWIDDLESLIDTVTGLAESFGLLAPGTPEEVRGLCQLSRLAAAENLPPAEVLEPGGPERADGAAVVVVAQALRRFAVRRGAVLSAQQRAAVGLGANWLRVPRDWSATPPISEVELARLTPAGIDLSAFTGPRAAENYSRFELLVQRFETAARQAEAIALQIGIDPEIPVADLGRLVELADLARMPNRALPQWFTPDGEVLVEQMVAALTAAHAELAAAREVATTIFEPELVRNPDVPEAIARLQERGPGFGRGLVKQVRDDRKLIGRLTVTGSWRKDLHSHLADALRWYRAQEQFTAITGEYAGLLGRYLVDGEPDVPAVVAATEQSRRVVRLAGCGPADHRARGLLAGIFADGVADDPVLACRRADLSAAIQSWDEECTRAPLAAVVGELAGQTPAAVARWLRAHLDPLKRAETLIESTSALPAPGDGAVANLTLADAREMVHLAQVAQVATADFDNRQEVDRRVLGPWYRGLDTDCGRLSADQTEIPAGCEPMWRLLERAQAASATASVPPEAMRLLGRYAAIEEYGTRALADALQAATVIVRDAGAAVLDPVRRRRLCGVLADDGPPRPDLARKGEKVAVALDIWIDRTAEHHATALLQKLPLATSIEWMRAHLEPFRRAVDFTGTVSRVVGNSELTLSQARRTVDMIRKARLAEESLRAGEQQWSALFGQLYAGAGTDADQIGAALDWARGVRRAANPRNYHGSGGAVRSGHGLPPLSETAARVMLDAAPETTFAHDREQWNQRRAEFGDCFGVPHRDAARQRLTGSLSGAAEWLGQLGGDPNGPDAWYRYASAVAGLTTHGLRGLPENAAREGFEIADLEWILEKSVLTAWVDQQLERDQRLSPLRADEREREVVRFREGDLSLIRNAPAKVIDKVNRQRPQNITIGSGATILREAEKKTRHMPVRKLLGDCGEIVRRIKPCFMMSPLTVSQFLPPDFRFDVVIFDEASQVLPEDAVNSLYRARALIVAGDQNQLPPTSFFSVTGDAGEAEYTEDGVDQFESVLGLCKGSGVLRGLPLRWHYRSRHEDLIAFSNNDFYDNKMITFPGVYETGPDIGVEFFKADGVYDRGGRRDNPREAALVAQRVIHHFRTRSELTLGVVALSKSQAEAIEAAVADARARHPELEKHFSDDRLDGFFVKNLESVQGDERDVIILSVGYGPDKDGKLRSEFGPINRSGGWRRLNVAVTRARQRVELVASFSGAELGTPPNDGVHHLKRYLQYAESGSGMLAAAVAPDERPHIENPFLEDVASLLTEWGYDVVPRIGVAGYRIDLAVRHPQHPGVFALGIECDGPMYDSTRVARDRDRLREDVLVNLGWTMHRIWGTAWHRDRPGELARLRSAVEAAVTGDPRPARPPAAPVNIEKPTQASGTGTVPPAENTRAASAATPSWATEYDGYSVSELHRMRTDLADRTGQPWVAVQDREAQPLIAEICLAIVRREGPIELDMLVARIRDAWALGRAGGVVRNQVETVLARSAAQGTLHCEGTTYTIPGIAVETVRTPTAICARLVGQVPAPERKLAITSMVRDTVGAQRAELVKEVARLFGWNRVGTEIRVALEGDLDDLIRAGIVREASKGLSYG
ncbi:DUF3320 domain-containing protein [Nocardia thailandica]|uniref:DUF3320 domain-containing protein n=1 Tax=Nocardia thailandica TaxID=257275 RepID=UPI000A03F4C5|nr:DUF3320 domain-containing protein [Nocardia thailandica]